MAKVEQKQVVVNEIKEKLEKAASVVMVDARGLTVEQDTALRKQLRDAGVDYKVYKNTMMHFAIQGTEFEGLDEYLAGPSAFAFSYEDATAGASILNKVAKDVKELEFKAGVVEGVVYDADCRYPFQRGSALQTAGQLQIPPVLFRTRYRSDRKERRSSGIILERKPHKQRRCA